MNIEAVAAICGVSTKKAWRIARRLWAAHDKTPPGAGNHVDYTAAECAAIGVMCDFGIADVDMIRSVWDGIESTDAECCALGANGQVVIGTIEHVCHIVNTTPIVWRIARIRRNNRSTHDLEATGFLHPLLRTRHRNRAGRWIPGRMARLALLE